MRIRLDVAYDGTDFYGWARQPGLRTVQDELSSALATVLRLPQVWLTCAGRTDAGVHARGQVVHLDLADDALAEDALPDALSDGGRRLVRRVNGVLSPDVRVLAATVAPAGFDARFSALWRRYAYRVADTPASVDPLRRREVLTWPRPLDLAAISAAAEPLLGLRDFAAFCRRREGATTVRTLLELTWTREETGVAVATVRADAFCHSMVRSLVGCLLAVGDGRRPQSWAGEVLAARPRLATAAVAPARGLTLEEVAYPAAESMSVRAEQTRARRSAVPGHDEAAGVVGDG